MLICRAHVQKIACRSATLARVCVAGAIKSHMHFDQPVWHGDGSISVHIDRFIHSVAVRAQPEIGIGGSWSRLSDGDPSIQR